MNSYISSAGLKLKEWRVNNQLSQSDIAEIIEFSERTIYTWEHGLKLPGYDAIISIANMMGVSTDWLLGQTDDCRTAHQILLKIHSTENNS